jgi:hypothetical protein
MIKKFLSDESIIIDKYNNVYGRLSILYEFKKNHKTWCHCKCVCGNETDVLKSALGVTTVSCGCYHKEVQQRIRTNLTGIRFGRLLAVERVKNDNKIYYRCLCDCGSEKLILHSNLINGNSKSCGCTRTPRKPKHVDNIKKGHIFGRYTYTGIYKRNNNRTYFKCLCECGNEKFVRSDALINGTAKSCGCYRDDSASIRLSFSLDERALHWKGGKGDKGYCYKFKRASLKERVRKFFGDECNMW